MNVHERALELGAATLDFHLSTDDRATLDRHLASCLDCRMDINAMTEDARRIAARPVTHLSPEASATLRAALVRPRRGSSLAMVLVAAALLLLAAIAAATVGARLVERLDANRLAVQPAPSVGPSPLTSDIPSLGLEAPTAWTLTPTGTVAGTPFQLAAVATSDLGWVAIGERSCVETAVRNDQSLYDCGAAVARSADGRSWATVGTLPYATNYVGPMSGPEAGIVGVAAGPDGYVAVGYTRDGGARPVMAIPDGAAWWSADGVAWERALLGDGARPTTVFRAPDRWLIGGVVYQGVDIRNDRPIGAIWSSTDGRTWTRIEDDATFDVGGYVDTMEDPASGGIDAFASNGEVIVAGGRTCADGGLPCRAAVWVSPDGTAWERVTELPAGDGVVALAAPGGTFVAAARRCPASGDCTTVVLSSRDGRRWEAVQGELAAHPVMTASNGTVVLVTGEYRELDVRATGDGTTWQALGTVAAPERVNWGSPVLLSRADGSTDLLIRFDPVTDPDTEADVYTAAWTIAPTP